MKQTFGIAAIALLIVLTTYSPLALAKDGKGRGSEEHQRVEVRVENENEEAEEAAENRIEVRAASPLQVEVQGQRFEIRGTISSISGNSFVIAGQTVNIDPTQVREFEQKGILQVGNFAKVEGVVINGSNFAREIKVLGTGAGRFRLEIRNAALGVGNTALITQATVTPAATPTATSSASTLRAEVKAAGPIASVTAFLEQILVFLRNLVA